MAKIRFCSHQGLVEFTRYIPTQRSSSEYTQLKVEILASVSIEISLLEGQIVDTFAQLNRADSSDTLHWQVILYTLIILSKIIYGDVSQTVLSWIFLLTYLVIVKQHSGTFVF